MTKKSPEDTNFPMKTPKSHKRDTRKPRKNIKGRLWIFRRISGWNDGGRGDRGNKLIVMARICVAVSFTNTSVTHQLTYSSFVVVSSKHLHSQTVRARKLKFWEKVHLPPPVTCHMSHVACHMSHVTCHMSHVKCHMSHVTCQIKGYF